MPGRLLGSHSHAQAQLGTVNGREGAPVGGGAGSGAGEPGGSQHLCSPRSGLPLAPLSPHTPLPGGPFRAPRPRVQPGGRACTVGRGGGGAGTRGYGPGTGPRCPRCRAHASASARARDGVRGCSRRQHLPAGASRTGQPSPPSPPPLLPALLRPGWRWSLKWGERLQQTPASARRGLKGRAAIAAAAAAAVACATENRLEMGLAFAPLSSHTPLPGGPPTLCVPGCSLAARAWTAGKCGDSAGARDGVRGLSRRQYLPAGASRAAQPSPTLPLLPPLLRPGWRWMGEWRLCLVKDHPSFASRLQHPFIVQRGSLLWAGQSTTSLSSVCLLWRVPLGREFPIL
ncbi:translation initiation factor IF-2-like isoform X1 [Felis catus]|uniref:translation initiation factor IF-2-like isoform X1 n=1 Tax=Felis catus TaxID=9685 RepID=UPI001D19F9CD|nr:translation initiation factor IF-2-like isoform X1 [Felis catus]XP_044907565.1 translation initiation factor IF-2-like isoform X1 [Felis catus]